MCCSAPGRIEHSGGRALQAHHALLDLHHGSQSLRVAHQLLELLPLHLQSCDSHMMIMRHIHSYIGQ